MAAYTTVDGADRLIGQRLMDLAPLRRNWRHDWAAEDTLARRPHNAAAADAAAEITTTAAAAAPAFVVGWVQIELVYFIVSLKGAFSFKWLKE